MTTSNLRRSLERLGDRDLLAETRRLAERERGATAEVIAALMELDARKLYLGEGCSSLFTYCTQVLHCSEHAAYGRIEAARAARRFPSILDQLADGRLTLTTVGLLAPHLTPENHEELLSSARHKSKREVEHIVAAVRPLPAVAPVIRKLPVPRADAPVRASQSSRPTAVAEDDAVPPEGLLVPCAIAALPGELTSPPPSSVAARETTSQRAVVKPLAPERYKVQMTVSSATHDKLRRAQDLLRHCIPSGDPAAIFDRALTLLVADLEKRKLAAAERPRAGSATPKNSRYVPATFKREVWARDGSQCAFIGAEGRCTERGFLEVHHVVPFADGGATDAGNLELRCRAHNVYEAGQWFGPMTVKEGAAEYRAELGPDRVAVILSRDV